MPTEISPANFETALGECYDAIADDDAASALKWYRLAEVQFAGLSQSSSGDGASKTRRASLDAVKKVVEDMQASTGLFEITSRIVPG